MKTAISYPGGKIRIASWIVNFFPEHELYCEPFAGSASVFFKKERSKNEILNDRNGDMINFLLTVRDNPEELKKYLQQTPYSRKYFNELTEKWWQNNERPVDSVKRAGEYFSIMEMAYTGNIEPTGFSRSSPHTTTDKVDTFNNKISQRIEKCSERLMDVCIEDMDYKECIETYNYDSTLFYCDPPYYKRVTDYKSSDFSHEEFSKSIKNVDGNVIVSYGDNIPPSFVDMIQNGWYVVSQTRNQTVNHLAEDADEHLIANFDITK